MSSPGSGISLPHAGHTPTTVSCPTPARRRHRTTFTQVRLRNSDIKKYSNWKFNLRISFFFSLIDRQWKIGTTGRVGSSFCKISLSWYLLPWRIGENYKTERGTNTGESQWTLNEFFKAPQKSIFELDQVVMIKYFYANLNQMRRKENWKSI